MWKLRLAALALALFGVASPALAQQNVRVCVPIQSATTGNWSCPDVTATAPFPTTAVPVINGVLTDRTITSASGASQSLMSAATAALPRKAVTVQNTGNANCGVNPTGGTAAIGGAGTLTLAPLGSYTPSIATQTAVTIICTAGQPIYANEVN